MGSIIKKRLIEEKEKLIPSDKRLSRPVSSAIDSDAIIGSNAFQTDQYDSDSVPFTLELDSDSVLLGIIYSEILSKPLSLRRR